MTPFQVNGRGVFKMRVEWKEESSTLSTGTYTSNDADDVAAVVDKWKGKRGLEHKRANVLEALLAKPPRISLSDAYQMQLDGTLDAHMAKIDAVHNTVDLRPYVTQWHREKSRAKKGAASADNYLRQLGVLYPEDDSLTLATFTRKELLRRLKALDVDEPTRTRYKAAASSFAMLLVDEELLEHNFVRTIPGFGENPERVVYYAMDDAKRLIAGMPQPYAGLAAVAAGFCAEWGALSRLIVSDVDLKANPITAHVRGSKRAWRDRVVPLIPELAWVLPYVRPLLGNKLPTACVFEGVHEWDAIDIQREAADELKIVATGEEIFGRHSIHDWRHSHAVWLLKLRYSEQIAAAHLGHKNTDLVRKRYGVFIPDQHDYARVDSTKSATPPRARHEGGRRK